MASIKHFPNCSFPLSSQPMTQELWESSKVYLPFFYTKTDYIFLLEFYVCHCSEVVFNPKEFILELLRLFGEICVNAVRTSNPVQFDRFPNTYLAYGPWFNALRYRITNDGNLLLRLEY